MACIAKGGRLVKKLVLRGDGKKMKVELRASPLKIPGGRGLVVLCWKRPGNVQPIIGRCKIGWRKVVPLSSSRLHQKGRVGRRRYRKNVESKSDKGNLCGGKRNEHFNIRHRAVDGFNLKMVEIKMGLYSS